MAKNNNLTDFLKDLADGIRAKKGTSVAINPQDFRSEIESIETGSDTTDATATEDKVFLDETFYAGGQKKTGTFTIEPELNSQNELIASIRSALEGKTAGSGGEKPTLFAPSISFDSSTTALTVSDSGNGSFSVNYDLYANDIFVATLASKSVLVKDYLEHNETLELKVQARADNFNNSAYSNIVQWVKIDADGTEGLAYSLSSDGTYAICNGIGTATDTEIEIAATVNGVPVTQVGNYAFSNNKSITKVTIGQNITRIGEQAFMSCTNIQTVLFGTNNISLQNHAFLACSSLKEVVANLFVSNTGCFAGCSSLVCFTLTGATTSNVYDRLGSSFLQNCTSLKRIDLSAISMRLTLQSKSDISSNNENLQIKVPANKLDGYKSATNWCDIADKIVTEFTNEL